MIQLKIYYSIRKKDGEQDIALFSDYECAKIDQELQEHFQKEGKMFLGSFLLVVDGITYIEEVITREDYIKYLKGLGGAEKYIEILSKGSAE